ncbi:MAG: hypothetical protein IBJ13_00905 [Sphingopyxis sp.]|nr:hypothetical protein [Sphingopyxis sp.]
MNTVAKQLTSPDHQEQIVISQRDDATFTYQRRMKDGANWGPLGPECGIYDSALTAETEAMQRVSWLALLRQ